MVGLKTKRRLPQFNMLNNISLEKLQACDTVFMSVLNRLLSVAAWATFDHIARLFLSLTPNPDVKKYYVNVKQVWLRRLTVQRKALSPELIIKFYLFCFLFFY